MRRVRGWPLIVGAAVAAAGLAFFLANQGLERADQWSSVLSLLVVGVPGLVIAPMSRRRRRPRAAGASEAEPADGTGAVTQFNRGGVNIVNTGTMGDVAVRRTSR
jgi:hypothetical protein